MEESNVEYLFNWLDKLVETIGKHQQEPYLDSLAIAMESLFINKAPEAVSDVLSDEIIRRLDDINLKEIQSEAVHKAIQLSIIKGMQKTTQQQHIMTPESVALIVGYLAGKLSNNNKNLRIFDPVSGTANLLITVLKQLKEPGQAYASEIDPTLIKLALMRANLEKKHIEFFHQDSLSPFLVDPVDLIVADLPVGYYPDDIQANDYELKAQKGHSYSHHLLIEQSLKYTKDNGYLLFLVPEFLFDSDESDRLYVFLKENAHIVGLLRLPESAFVSKQNIKSILILQKKTKGSIGPKQPLLVDLPSLNNSEAMNDILSKMNAWFKEYHSNIEEERSKE